MKHQEADLQVQMKEQCEDYKELLSEKMARDMEIAAYRSGQSRVINLIKLFFFFCLSKTVLNKICFGLDS